MHNGVRDSYLGGESERGVEGTRNLEFHLKTFENRYNESLDQARRGYSPRSLAKNFVCSPYNSIQEEICSV